MRNRYREGLEQQISTLRRQRIGWRKMIEAIGRGERYGGTALDMENRRKEYLRNLAASEVRMDELYHSLGQIRPAEHPIKLLKSKPVATAKPRPRQGAVQLDRDRLRLQALADADGARFRLAGLVR